MAKRSSNFAYFMGFIPIYVFLKLGGLLPFSWRVAIGGTLLSGFVRWFPPARNRVMENLRIVWPEKSRREGLALCAGMGRQMGRTITEILFGEDFQTHHYPFRVSGPGQEALVRANAEGLPTILVSGHFGQWDAARIYMRDELGITCGGIYRPNNNPYYDPYFVRGTEASGTPLVPRTNEGFRSLLRHLKAGGTFAFLADQVYHKGKRLPFLGAEALTTMSPAEMALRYKGPFIPTYVIRRDDEKVFEIIFEEPVPHSDAETMMRAFNESASKMIEAYPEQWLWLHRRWKPGRRRKSKDRAAS